MTPSATRRLSGAGAYVVDGQSIRHPDGTVSGVVRTGELDIEALDSSRRAHVLSVFTRLCNTMDTPLQIVVRTRALRPDDVRQRQQSAPAAGAARARTGAHELDDAMNAFWARRLESTPAYRREVFVATRAPTMSRLTPCIARICESVRAMGIPAEPLHDDALASVATAGVERRVGVEWTAHPHFVRVGGTYLRGFSLRRLPGHAVTAGWLTPLLRVAVECDVAIHLAPASLSEALTTLGRRLRDLSAHRLLEGERGVVADVHVDIGLDSAFELRTRLARNLGRPLHLSITAMVRAATIDQLRQASETMRVAFQSALASSEPAHFRHPAAFMSTMPLGVDRLHANKLVESSAAAVCFPWVDAGCADPGGYRLGASLRGRL
ncbi:MAG: hypothetical protein JOZ75_10745 [Candidatus Dormibacteraeota bacterium]|nr:hypothetical protein [Candidatus Dormibacteraeota bacterium]